MPAGCGEALRRRESALPPGLGLVSGAFYLLGFMLYQWDIRVNGVTLSALFMKMGVIVSILTAVCFFGEVPRRCRWRACSSPARPFW